MMVEKKKRVLPTVTLDGSYRLCRERVRQRYAGWTWIAWNLDRQERDPLFAILALTARTEKLCDIHVAKAARGELLEDLREDFRNNFMEEESTDQFPALLDTMQRFRIPQQYLHDIVAAADMCLRIDRFSSFDQWLQVGCRMGGGTMLAAAPVVGVKKAGFEPAAIQLGQALYLTWLLNDIADEIQKLQFFLPTDELNRFKVDLERHNPANVSADMLSLWGELISRIENLYRAGATFVEYLGLDGERVFTSLVSMGWHLLMQMKSNPRALFANSSELAAPVKMGFQIKHVLGLESAKGLIRKSADH